MDLASAKGRDMERYYDTLGQLKESYSRCAMVSICVIVFFFFCFWCGCEFAWSWLKSSCLESNGYFSEKKKL